MGTGKNISMATKIKKQHLVIFGGVILLLTVFIGLNLSRTSIPEKPAQKPRPAIDAETKEVIDLMTSNSAESYSYQLVRGDRTTSLGEAFLLRGNNVMTLSALARLPDPLEGTVYQVWLADENNSVSAPLGTMEKKGEIYSFSLKGENIHQNLNYVLVTREVDTTDSEQEDIILITAPQ